nr:methylmalonyl-CoA mutase family protein [Marinitoga lauensis]
MKKLRQERNNELVKKNLLKLRNAAENKENVMPYILEAVKSYATLGEITDVLRDVYGEYHEAVIL